MKIVISSQENQENSQLDARFGRCSYFAIYDTDHKTFEYKENINIHESQGAGISSAQSVVDLGVSAVITGNLGPKAKQVLDGNKIVGYRAENMTILQAIKAYENNELQRIDEAKKK